MLDQLLAIKDEISAGRYDDAQQCISALIRELAAPPFGHPSNAMAIGCVQAVTVKTPAPEPPKPKRQERKYTRTQRGNEALIHCPTINRLFHEMRRRLDISGHKLANSIGYASQSNIAGMRTRDKSKEFVATADAPRLVEIFGPEILAKDNPSLGES